MQQTAAIEQSSSDALASARQKSVRGRPFRPGQNSRQVVREKAEQRFTLMLTAFGQLDEVERERLRSAANLLTRAEVTSDHDQAARLVGNANRILAALRKRALAAKDPGQSLAEYLAHAHAPPSRDARADTAAPEGAATEARASDDPTGIAEPSGALNVLTASEAGEGAGT